MRAENPLLHIANMVWRVLNNYEQIYVYCSLESSKISTNKTIRSIYRVLLSAVLTKRLILKLREKI